MQREQFIDRFIELLIVSGKYPQQDITGYRAIDIIKLVFDEIDDQAP